MTVGFRTECLCDGTREVFILEVKGVAQAFRPHVSKLRKLKMIVVTFKDTTTDWPVRRKNAVAKVAGGDTFFIGSDK